MLIILGIHAFFCICLVANASSVVTGLHFRRLLGFKGTALYGPSIRLVGIVRLGIAVLSYYMRTQNYTPTPNFMLQGFVGSRFRSSGHEDSR